MVNCRCPVAACSFRSVHLNQSIIIDSWSQGHNCSLVECHAIARGQLITGLCMQGHEAWRRSRHPKLFFEFTQWQPPSVTLYLRPNHNQRQNKPEIVHRDDDDIAISRRKAKRWPGGYWVTWHTARRPRTWRRHGCGCRHLTEILQTNLPYTSNAASLPSRYNICLFSRCNRGCRSIQWYRKQYVSRRCVHLHWRWRWSLWMAIVALIVLGVSCGVNVGHVRQFVRRLIYSAVILRWLF